MIDTAVILKQFEEPDEVRTFDSCRSAIGIGCFSGKEVPWRAVWVYDTTFSDEFGTRSVI
jgi:hypothetical protein